MEGSAVICKGEFKVKITHVIMAHHHYGVAFSCNVSTSEILSMFACFGLVFCACGLFATWSLFLWFYSCVKFILRLKLVDAKSSHDLILIYFVPHHFFLWSLSFLIILWLQQNGAMATRIDWWDCPSTGKWSYNQSCVWCFDVASTKFATTCKKATWGILFRS